MPKTCADIIIMSQTQNLQQSPAVDQQMEDSRDSEGDQIMREKDVDRPEEQHSPCRPTAASVREELAEDSNDSDHLRCPQATEKLSSGLEVSSSVAMHETPHWKGSNSEQRSMSNSDDVDVHTRGWREHFNRDTSPVNSVLCEQKTKNCRLTPKPEAGAEHDSTHPHSHMATSLQAQSPHAENCGSGKAKTDTNRQDVRVRKQEELGKPDLCVHIKQEPLDDFPSSSRCPTLMAYTDGCSNNTSKQRDSFPAMLHYPIPTKNTGGGLNTSKQRDNFPPMFHYPILRKSTDGCSNDTSKQDSYPPLLHYPLLSKNSYEFFNSASNLPLLQTGRPWFSIKIKEEPECGDKLRDRFHFGVEENTHSVQKDLHPDHLSPQTSSSDVKHNWLTVVQPSGHFHQQAHNDSASSGSAAVGQELPYGLAHVNNIHTFEPNSTNKAEPSNSAVEGPEQTEECSDDSDCDTLPVHFEARAEEVEIEKLYECGMCQIAFALPSQVHEHVIQHEASDRCYVCSQCKKSFPQIALLTQHMPVHTFSQGIELPYDDPKSFVCHVCSKVFRRLYELNRHQKIHSGSKPFMCDVCHKMFSRGDELNRHSKVHSGEKPFPCNECSRAFITNHELTQHKKSHFVNKPFNCPLCSRGFLRADKLFHHQQMHAGDRPFECDICQKGFITPSELRQHLKIHSGVKPFVCEVCFKAYLKVNDLNRHMKMHTGVKPFTCDVCGKAFHRTDILSRHKKIHNKVKRNKKSEHRVYLPSCSNTLPDSERFQQSTPPV